MRLRPWRHVPVFCHATVFLVRGPAYFLGPFRAEKRACPLAAEGDSPRERLRVMQLRPQPKNYILLNSSGTDKIANPISQRQILKNRQVLGSA